jgi:ABC-type transporter Mla subunit MlaD
VETALEAKIERRGRKPLPIDEKRVVTVSSRMSKEEASRLDEMRGEKQRGEFVRDVVFGTVVEQIPAINHQVWGDLGRALSNLNQLTKAVNGGRPLSLAELENEIDAMRDKLMGLTG